MTETLSDKRKELKDLMLLRTPEDNSILAVMFKRLAKDLFNSVEKQDKQFIKDVMETLHFTKEEVAWMKKRAGDKLT